MESRPSDCKTKRIRVFTRQGTVEGAINVPSGQKLMRHLNVASHSQNLLTVLPPVTGTGIWTMEPGPVALTFDSILFVTELSGFDPIVSDSAAAARYTRAPMRMQVQEYSVEGYLHVPFGGNPMARLNQDRHPFVAVTSVSVIGPDRQFAAAFLGVRRDTILAVQEMQSRPSIPIGNRDEVGVGS